MRFAPPDRVRVLTDVAPNVGGDFVLYWQTAARRTRANYALQHAIAHARTLGKPLVVLEALRVDYRWASDRLHRFCIDGMRENAAAYERAGVAHIGYVEPAPGAGRGLLEALARRAAVAAADDSAAFFLPRVLASAADALRRIERRPEAVDSNGLRPIHAADRAFAYAHQFRRFVQREIPAQLDRFPEAHPLRAARALPSLHVDVRRWLDDVRRRWPSAIDVDLASLPIDHGRNAV